MSETAPEKGRGLQFAEQQLLRHGWEQGKGLGRTENGISEAIKVKVKCDKGGVGHKESEQFTFHWWDHVFNKASASLAVESDQNGVMVKKMLEEEDGMISNKKPRKAMMKKSMLYGCFVKSATLLSGQEQPEQRLSISEDSSSSEDDEKLDLSSTKTLSDAQLMKACGGRTAHKGARHGFTMSAKLARLEQQEQEFMAKYGQKNQADKPTRLTEETSTKLSSAFDQERAEKTEQKKAEKKKQGLDETKENGVQDNTAASQEHSEETLKKRKKRPKHQADLESEDVTDPFVDTDTKKKRKKTKFLLEEGSTEMRVQEGEVAETAETQPTDESVSKKKRKKKKNPDKCSALEEGLSKNTLLDTEESAQSTESYEHEQQKEGATALHSTPDVSQKQKKKSSKANKGKSPAQEIDSCYRLDASTAENVEAAYVERESLPSKKRKSRKYELETETRLLDEPKKKRKKKDAK